MKATSHRCARRTTATMILTPMNETSWSRLAYLSNDPAVTLQTKQLFRQVLMYPESLGHPQTRVTGAKFAVVCNAPFERALDISRTTVAAARARRSPGQGKNRTKSTSFLEARGALWCMARRHQSLTLVM